MTRFDQIPDGRLISLVAAGNEEAGIFLVCHKYSNDIDYHLIRHYHSIEFKPDIISELYLRLRGKDGSWRPLMTFRGNCSLRTWFNRVVVHLIIEKQTLLTGKGALTSQVLPLSETQSTQLQVADLEPNDRIDLMYEAISRLKNDDYRFILLKEMEGYSAREVAVMLEAKRRREGTLKRRRDGSTVRPTDKYVHMVKARAVKELKAIAVKMEKGSRAA